MRNEIPNVNKAKQLIKKLNFQSSKLRGTSAHTYALKDTYDAWAYRLTSAIKLMDGNVPERSEHWKCKLPKIIDEIVKSISEYKITKDTKMPELTDPKNYYEEEKEHDSDLY